MRKSILPSANGDRLPSGTYNIVALPQQPTGDAQLRDINNGRKHLLPVDQIPTHLKKKGPVKYDGETLQAVS